MNRYHWAEDAACADMPTAWWTEKGNGYWGASPAHRRAIRICNGCPVTSECLRDQLDFERRTARSGRDGIFGGTTPQQRDRIDARQVTG